MPENFMIKEQILDLLNKFQANNETIKELSEQIPHDDIYCEKHEVYFRDILEDCIESVYQNEDLLAEFNDIQFDLKTTLVKLQTMTLIKEDFQKQINEIQAKNDELNDLLRELIQKEYGECNNFFLLELFSFSKFNHQGKPLLDVLKNELKPIFCYSVRKNKDIMLVNSGDETYDKNSYFELIHQSLNLDRNIKGMIDFIPFKISLDNDLFLENMELILENLSKKIKSI